MRKHFIAGRTGVYKREIVEQVCAQVNLHPVSGRRVRFLYYSTAVAGGPTLGGWGGAVFFSWGGGEGGGFYS